jgi:hypothetical protein
MVPRSIDGKFQTIRLNPPSEPVAGGKMVFAQRRSMNTSIWCRADLGQFIEIRPQPPIVHTQ